MRFQLVFTILLWSTLAFGRETTITGDGAAQSAVEGTLSQVSKLPPPQGNAYPDCYYTATLNINHISSGQSIPKRIILVLPGFFSRQYAPEAKYKVGDKIRATVVPFASMPDKVRQTQQADELEDVDLDFYFPDKIALVQDFQLIASPIPFADKGQKPEERTSFQPLDHKARVVRQAQMQHDLQAIDSLLAKHGGDWDKWYDSLKDFRARYRIQYEAKAQRWVGDSFFSAGFLDYGKISSDYIKSIIAFKNYLAARNVDLILLRVPDKGEIVDDLFTSVPPEQISNPYLLKMYKELLEADVEIITDIIPRAKEARLKYPLMYWYQDFPEKHPAEGMAWVVAEAFSKRLSRYMKISNTPKVSFKLGQESTIKISQYKTLWPEGRAKFNPKEHADLSVILTNDGSALRPKQGLNSPILMVGSSFLGSPSLNLGGSIPAYLAYLTGIVPDILYRDGSNDTIPRTLAREGDSFLKNRSVCLFPLVPWIVGPLDSPPIVDPAKSKKTLLSSHAGDDLQKQIQVAAGTPKHVFTFSTEGMTVQARNKGSRIGGSFRLALPQGISDFPFFMIEIESATKNGAAIKAKYGVQTDMVHRSFSQPNSEDILVFKTETDHAVELDINNIHKDVQTVIESIKIYGIQR